MNGIVGLGVDIVDCGRIEELLQRHGAAFLRRRRAAHVAGLFAAKEATMKALGTGWAAGVGFLQIEVVRQASGSPGLQLHGAAHRRAESLGVGRLWLSISHDGPSAVAVVVLECVRNE